MQSVNDFNAYAWGFFFLRSGSRRRVTLSVIAAIAACLGVFLVNSFLPTSSWFFLQGVAFSVGLIPMVWCLAGRLHITSGSENAGAGDWALFIALSAAALIGMMWAAGARGPTSSSLQVVVPSTPDIVALIPAAVFEELLFRVVLPLAFGYVAFGQLVPTKISILAAILAFSLWHQPDGVVSALDHAVFGGLMFVLFRMSGSLLVPVLFHFMNNVASMAFIYVMNPMIGYLGGELAVVVVKYLLWIMALVWLFPFKKWDSFHALAPMNQRQYRHHRIAGIDFLRGIALLLIVTENALLFIGPAMRDATDQAVRGVYAVLFEYRGINLFSILLGYSLFSLLRDKKQDVALRNIAFIALGTVHGLFVLSADIMALYGLVLAFVVWNIQRNTGLGRRWTVLVLIGWLTGALLTGSLNGLAEGPAASLTASSWDGAFEDRAVEWLSLILGAPVAALQLLLPITLGYLTARYLDGSGTRKRWMSSRALGVSCCSASLLLCLPRGLELAWSTAGIPVSWAAESLAAGGGLVGALGLWLLCLRKPSNRSGCSQGFLMPAAGAITSAGRNTLSGYLLSSVAMTALFTPYGLGLAGNGVTVVLLCAWGFWVLFCLAIVFFQRPLLPLEEYVRSYSSLSLTGSRYPTSDR